MSKNLIVRRNGTAIFHEEGHGIDVGGQMFKCPSCTTPGLKGVISRGTLIEIQCRRCNTKYVLRGN